MRFNVGYATDVGRKRSQNQDNFTVVPELGLFLVADGMGGHRGGETASAMVVDIVPQVVANFEQQPDWDPRAVIIEAIRAANAGIFKRAAETPELEGMGTTTTALLFKDNRLTIGHVGDSRCYFIAGRENGGRSAIWQATRDHSLVQEKLRAGLITREEAKHDRMKNVITRSVGYDAALEVETYEMEIKPGDIFLICSDGLSGMVSDSTILSVLEQHAIHGSDLKRAADLLIETANKNGGDDNITVITVKVNEAHG